MKSSKFICNIARIILALTLIVLIFVPTVNLGLNSASPEDTIKLMNIVNGAYENNDISEEEYHSIMEKLVFSQAELYSIQNGEFIFLEDDEDADPDDYDNSGFVETLVMAQMAQTAFERDEGNSSGDYSDELNSVNKQAQNAILLRAHYYAALQGKNVKYADDKLDTHLWGNYEQNTLAIQYQNEVGQEDLRYTYSQSFFSFAKSIPDSITVFKYVFGADDLSAEEVLAAVNVTSIDTTMLVLSVFDAGNGSIWLSFFFICAVFCLIVAPLFYIIFALKQVINLLKGNYFDQAPKFDDVNVCVLSLILSLALPLMYRGTSLNFILIAAIALSIIYFAICALTPSEKSVTAPVRNFVNVSKLIFACALVIALVSTFTLCNFTPSADPLLLDDYYEEAYEELIDSSTSTDFKAMDKQAKAMAVSSFNGISILLRITASLALILILFYICGSLERTAEIEHEETHVVLSKYLRFIPTAILTYIAYDGFSLSLLLVAALFIIEIAYSVFRRKNYRPILKDLKDSVK